MLIKNMENARAQDFLSFPKKQVCILYLGKAISKSFATSMCTFCDLKTFRVRHVVSSALRSRVDFSAAIRARRTTAVVLKKRCSPRESERK